MRRILVVTADAEKRRNLATWLSTEGFEVVLVATFTAGKAQLKGNPDLVIADVRLGAYNGLHLAIHAKGVGIPAMVMGTDDPVLARDAQAIGVRWLGASLDPSTLVALVREFIGPGHQTVSIPTQTPGAGEMAWWGLSSDTGLTRRIVESPHGGRMIQH